MKSLTLAFLLVMAAAAVCFLTLSMLGVSSEGAGSISSVFFGGISYVHQVLGTRGGRASVSALPQSVVSFERFHLPWYTMIVYGGLVYAAALQAGSGIGGVLAAVSGIGLDAILPTLATVGFMVGAVSAWFVGAWIGRRCAGWGILATLVAASLGRALASVVDFAFIPAGEFMLIFGEPKSLEFFATQVAAGSLVFWPFALLGYWRGRCTKNLRYLAFLMKRVPRETQHALVELAYDEAVRAWQAHAAEPEVRVEQEAAPRSAAAVAHAA